MLASRVGISGICVPRCVRQCLCGTRPAAVFDRTKSGDESPHSKDRRRRNRLLTNGPSEMYTVVYYSQTTARRARGLEFPRSLTTSSRFCLPGETAAFRSADRGYEVPPGRRNLLACNAQSAQLQGSRKNAVHLTSNRGRSLRRGPAAQGVEV